MSELDVFGRNGPPTEVFLRPPSQRRLPVVADANALISDALHHADCGFSFLTLLAREDVITLATPGHIREKVREHLPNVALQRHICVERAMETWRCVHEPLIHFVELPPIGAGDARPVRAVHRRDAEDGPVAQLGMLLAPSMVLSWDTDLRDEGIGLTHWVGPARKLLELARLEEKMHNQARGMLMLARLASTGIGGLAQAAARWPWAAGLLVGAAVMALADSREPTTSRLRRLGTGMGETLERVSPLVEAAFEEHARAVHQVHATLLHPDGAPSAANDVARLLAELGAPYPARMLLSDLRQRDQDLTESALNSLLRSHPAFVAVRGRGWQLGVRG